jgi:hypothetical protein
MDKTAMLETICGDLQAGASMAQSCEGANRPHINSLKLWCRNDPAIADRVLTARKLGAFAILDNLLNDPAPQPGKVSAVKYIISRLNLKDSPHG